MFDFVYFDPGRLALNFSPFAHLVPVSGPLNIGRHKPRRFKRSQRRAKK